ncbi:MAG: FG-GAP repeat domain-containing protein, partial [Pirellulales bacterium]
TGDEYDEVNSYYPGDGVFWEHIFSLDDREFNVLLHNNHDGTFSNVTDEAGLGGQGWSGDVAVFDFDDDGDSDLLVTNMFGCSQLYRNDGQGHFENAASEVLGKTSVGAIGCKAFDYNNDGRLDLFITDMHSDMWIDFEERSLVQPGKKFQSIAGPADGPNTEQRRFMLNFERRLRDELGLDLDAVLFGNSFFRNEGSGRFTEISDTAGLETFWPWGVAVGDFNNDAYEDLFIAAGMGYPWFYWPDSLMLNTGKGTFADRAADEGIEPPLGGTLFPQKIQGRDVSRSSRSAATADFDGDGRLDLMVANFNDRPYYFKNQFPRRQYLALRLEGTRSTRDAIGAVVKLYRGDEVLVRQVQCTGGYLS